MRDGAGILGADQQLLRVEHLLQVGFALQILAPGQAGGDRRLGDDLDQQRFPRTRMGDRREAVLGLAQRGEEGAAIELDALRLVGGDGAELAAKTAAVEDRREEVRADAQGCSDRAAKRRRLAESACAQADAGQEGGSGASHVAFGGGDPRFRGAHVRTPDEQLARLDQCYVGNGEVLQARLRGLKQRRLLPDQYGEGVAGPRQRLDEPQLVGLELAHLDGLEPAVDARGVAEAEPDPDDPLELARLGDVPVQEGDPVGQGRMLDIGAGYLGLDHQVYSVAIESRGGEAGAGGTAACPLAAEQVDIVRNIEAGEALAEVEGAAAAIVGVGAAEPGRAGDHRQHRGARDAELRSRTLHPRRRGCDVGVACGGKTEQPLQRRVAEGVAECGLPRGNCDRAALAAPAVRLQVRTRPHLDRRRARRSERCEQGICGQVVRGHQVGG